MLTLLAVAACADPWLNRMKEQARHDCDSSRDWVRSSREIESSAKKLAASADPSDATGREVAFQAAVKASVAAAKHGVRAERECRRLKSIQAMLPMTEGAGALPVFAKGEIRIQTPDGWKVWDWKSPVSMDQAIKTGGSGYVELLLPGVSGEVRLGANSSFTPSEHALKLHKGFMDYAHDALERAGGTRRQIVAGSNPFSIRGTRLFVAARGDTARLAVLEGEAVHNDGATGMETSITAGYRVVMKGGKIARVPEPIDPKTPLREWLSQ